MASAFFVTFSGLSITKQYDARARANLEGQKGGGF
jgi:hypothetical protein